MAWKKNSPDAIRRFEERVAVPGANRESMFGCPVLAIGGERYALLHEDHIALRLAPDDGAALVRAGGWAWEPMPGRRSKGRVVVPESIASDSVALRAWVAKAVRFASMQAAKSAPSGRTVKAKAGANAKSKPKARAKAGRVRR